MINTKIIIVSEMDDGHGRLLCRNYELIYEVFCNSGNPNLIKFLKESNERALKDALTDGTIYSTEKKP